MPKLKKPTTATKQITDDVKEVIEDIERENYAVPDCNIVLDENGVSEDIEMLAGYIDADGVLHKTFAIREMNGKDEEFINNPTLKQNGGKQVTALLSRCVVRIGTLEKKDYRNNPKEWEKIIRSLYIGDQDFILLQIRKLSLGNEIECEHQCPDCKAKITSFVDVDELEILPFLGEREIPFELPRGYTDSRGTSYKTGVIRLATGEDREMFVPVAKKNASKANTLMLAHLCKFDNGVNTVSPDLIGNLVAKDRKYLFDLMNENAFGVKTSTSLTCPECGEEFVGSLSMVNFM